MISTVSVPFVPALIGAIGLPILQLLLFFVSLWMIFLILIQRGKGGGLTAAFGGGGGDSAFGAKAGDAFTKITIVTALVWITLCMVTIAAYNPPDSPENPFAAQNDTENVENQGASAGMSAGTEAGSEDADSDAEATGSESTAGEDEGSADTDSASADAGEAGSAAATEGSEAESTDP